jgi:hypothetical protein
MSTLTSKQVSENMAYVKEYAAARVAEGEIHWGAVIFGAMADEEIAAIVGRSSTPHYAMRAMRGTLRGQRHASGAFLSAPRAAKAAKAAKKVVDDILA